jgi:plasmid stabilization system protein ParE
MVIITWDKNALISLESIYKYIAKDSLLEARKVRDDIFKIVSSLINHPERFS